MATKDDSRTLQAFNRLLSKQRHLVQIGPVRDPTDAERKCDPKLQIQQETDGIRFTYSIVEGEHDWRMTVLTVRIHVDLLDSEIVKCKVNSSRCEGDPAIFRVISRIFDRASNLHKLLEMAKEEVCS